MKRQGFQSSGGGTRTPNLLIMIQHANSKNTGKYGDSKNCTAPGAAADAGNPALDPELQAVIERWPGLSHAIKAGILAMVRATERL